MPRALDHVVLPCADLSAAARLVEDAGFLVGRRNRHPWGTENHIVQFPGAFLELIALAPDAAPLDPAGDAFPFAGFLAGQGASPNPSGMIVLRSHDALADAAGFRAAGIGSGRTLHFARAGQAPDGTVREVAFTLAFGEAPAMPDLGFFVCQQHRPENFWDPAMQRHPNGATRIASLVIEAADPAIHAPFLSRFADQPDFSVGEGPLILRFAEETRLLVAPSDAPSGASLAAIHCVGRVGVQRTIQIGTVALVIGT